MIIELKMANRWPRSDLSWLWLRPSPKGILESTCSKNFFLNLHIFCSSVDAVIKFYICTISHKPMIPSKQSILMINFHRAELPASLASSNSIISYCSGSQGRGSLLPYQTQYRTASCTKLYVQLNSYNQLLVVLSNDLHQYAQILFGRMYNCTQNTRRPCLLSCRFRINQLFQVVCTPGGSVEVAAF